MVEAITVGFVRRWNQILMVRPLVETDTIDWGVMVRSNYILHQSGYHSGRHGLHCCVCTTTI